METMIKNTGSKEKTRRTQEACHMVKQYDASAATTSELTEKYIIRRGWSFAVDVSACCLGKRIQENTAKFTWDLQSDAFKYLLKKVIQLKFSWLIHKHLLTSDGGKASGLTSDKVEFMVKDQTQLRDSNELSQDKAELAEVHQCQSSESGCFDVQHKS